MKRRILSFAMVAALSLGAACYDSTGNGYGGGPGTLVLRLTTPHPDDGAVLFEVTGPPVESVAAANGSLRVFTRHEGVRVVGAVVGDLANGAVVTLQVPDRAAAAGYSARVLEVSDRQSVLRASLAGYALRVAP
jgi:hypothetical protein